MSERYPPDQARQVVEVLYRALLGRPSDPDGLRNAVNLLVEGNANEETLAHQFLRSPEFAARYSRYFDRFKTINPNNFAAPRLIRNLADCHFYHTMDLPEVGLQQGQWDLRGDFVQYVGNVTFTQKRVLDVGCASGFLSFSAEAAGAREVVSFDMDIASRQHWLPFRNHLSIRTQTNFIRNTRFR